ncbi:uncharacterized protein CYBJADRAFT_173537 [Cyberlindnera jadinii NRRL Y-1542]|uniref:Uncharacterized protein n=1 Tax=Cyberlindnera jadinii (strain ATCC 18201 / CBS 1600 / BCRC 20928 / JCM 3617 / NBRC 0987 / NRRL Y-1542) TaxID=983966 RepID=A0A1E4S0K6_CYBJN|nr:hypothetical protein CYBJADRAFT_173537 [Cyberlindnera jadinii NRRL Y-1542]ODV73022.1 hypothetical protein CYBJADRAFT_173537 [Cyberlindnera jadinii NRRL Y-1542]
MSRKNEQDVKRQLFKGVSSRKPASFESAASNLLSRTLRKQSDKYKRPMDDTRFVIHKSTSPEDYLLFNSQHPMRESRLQAFSQAEQTFEEIFDGYDDSGSEDDEPDLSNVARSSELIKDDILISVPGYSREEITACKRLRIQDRKNVRLSKVHPLERAFADVEFLRDMNERKKQEYTLINQEYLTYFQDLAEERDHKRARALCKGVDEEDTTARQFAYLREIVMDMENNDWMYNDPVIPKRY